MRARLRYTITDLAGNALEAATVLVHEQGTTDAVADLFAAETGGAPVASLTTDDAGQVLGWLDTPRRVDLVVSGGAGAAHYPWAPLVPVLFADTSPVTVDAVPAPADTVRANAGGLERVKAHVGAASVTINLDDGNVHLLDVDQDTTVTFAGATAETEDGDPVSCTIVVETTRDGDGWVITWPVTVLWANGLVPVPSTLAGRVDEYAFRTVDGGTTWHGFLLGVDFR